ncbi:MAG: hypothetical protein O3A00_05260 [Planctomycetota bacterium]|nr:hypothetical protein [Planctomycetota bacterium]
MEKNKPVKRFRLGRITAAVWLNRNEKGDAWYTITITRSYKDGDSWKDTESFRRDDLPLVAKVADLAFAWIWDQTSNAQTEPVSQDEETL